MTERAARIRRAEVIKRRIAPPTPLPPRTGQPFGQHGRLHGIISEDVAVFSDEKAYKTALNIQTGRQSIIDRGVETGLFSRTDGGVTLNKLFQDLTTSEKNLAIQVGFTVPKPAEFTGIPGPAAVPPPGSLGEKIQESPPIKWTNKIIGDAFLGAQMKLNEAIVPLRDWTLERWDKSGWPSTEEVEEIVRTSKSPLEVQDRLGPKNFEESIERLAWLAGRATLGGIKDITYPLSIGVAPVTEREGWQGVAAEIVGSLLTVTPFEIMLYDSLRGTASGRKIISKLGTGDDLSGSEMAKLSDTVDDTITTFKVGGKKVTGIADILDDIEVPYSEVRRTADKALDALDEGIGVSKRVTSGIEDEKLTFFDKMDRYYTKLDEAEFVDTSNLLKRMKDAEAAKNARLMRELEEKLADGMRWLEKGEGIDITVDFKYPTRFEQFKAAHALTGATTPEGFREAMLSLFDEVDPRAWGELSYKAKQNLIKRAVDLFKSKRGTAQLLLTKQTVDTLKEIFPNIDVMDFSSPILGVGAISVLLESLELSREDLADLSPKDIEALRELRRNILITAVFHTELVKETEEKEEVVDFENTLDFIRKQIREQEKEKEKIRFEEEERRRFEEITEEEIREKEIVEEEEEPVHVPPVPIIEPVVEPVLEEPERIPPEEIPRLRRIEEERRREELRKIPTTELPEPYRVTFTYYMDSEEFKVGARSFVEALGIGETRRKIKERPSMSEIERLKGAERE